MHTTVTANPEYWRKQKISAIESSSSGPERNKQETFEFEDHPQEKMLIYFLQMD